MLDRPTVSVIVPMYGTERFLPKCVESLLSQTLNDMEIVLVDDESPDCCGEMADRYAECYPNVVSVHRKNGGLGPARNTGLGAARGRFVGFVDSDDWVEPRMYESLYEKAMSSQSQIVAAALKRVRDGETEAARNNPFADEIRQGRDGIFEVRKAFYGAAPEKVVEDPLPVSVCVRIYNTDMLKRNSVRFLNIRSEDIFFNIEAYKHASSVAAIPGTPYCYRKDDQPSITSTFNDKTLGAYFGFFEALMQFVDREPSELKEQCLIRARRRVIDYSRSLIVMIERSSNSAGDKDKAVEKVLTHPILTESCKGYPFWKLPQAQAAFFIAERFRWGQAARLMARLRG